MGNKIETHYHRIGFSVFFFLAMAAIAIWAPNVQAESNFFSGAGNCTLCHPASPSTCNGCHAHGTHPNSTKNTMNLVATTRDSAGAVDKSSFAPGEAMTVRFTGGYRSGWIRAILYNQSSVEISRSTGIASGGMGGGAAFPITFSRTGLNQATDALLTAPTTPGTYTYTVSWYGNKYDLAERGGATTFGPNWVPDPNNANHGEERISTNSFTVVGAPPSRRSGQVDFDGDAKTDITVWRASLGYWLSLRSSNGTSVNTQYGASGDVLVPGDYDGDTKADIAIYRPSTGGWFIVRSTNGTTQTVVFGVSGDIPVPGDYDGDGKTDIAVYRSTTGGWFIIQSSNGTTQSSVFGVPGDIPVPGDYDGDGKTDIAIYRPSSGGWFIIRSSNGTTQSSVFGISGDTPVPGDYDGDGKTDVAIYRPSTGAWFILRSSNGTTAAIAYGEPSMNDQPVPGDYDGDGKTDLAVYRPAYGNWFINRSSDGGTQSVQFGSQAMGDVPVIKRY